MERQSRRGTGLTGKSIGETFPLLSNYKIDWTGVPITNQQEIWLLGLTRRAAHIFLRGGITTISSLASMSPDALVKRVDGLGLMTMEELEDGIRRFHHKLESYKPEKAVAEEMESITLSAVGILEEIRRTTPKRLPYFFTALGASGRHSRKNPRKR